MGTSSAVREKPILFSAPMIKALLAGRKTMTRRLVKWQPYTPGDVRNWNFSGMDLGFYCTDVPHTGYVLRTRGGGGCWNDRTKPAHCPYGKPGDRLWVREAFRFSGGGNRIRAVYRANEAVSTWRKHDGPILNTLWRPSIHMPRAWSRITLEIIATRIERLQAISGADAIAEGVPTEPFPGTVNGEPATIYPTDPKYQFAVLWNSIHGVGTANDWNANPWVWAVTFRMEAK